MALDALGLLVMLGGETLRVLVIGLAYIKRGGKNRRPYAGELVQEGMFAHSRNPLYFANMVLLAGLCLIHNSLWFYLVGLPVFLLAYYSIVRAEENYLRTKFGEVYEAYCRRVNRFVPSPSGLWRTVRSMPFDWMRVVRKDYSTVFTFTTATLAMLAWEDVANFGYDASRRRVTVLVALWVLAFAGYLVLRMLKRRGALGVD